MHGNNRRLIIFRAVILFRSMAKVRILYLTSSLTRGGAEKQLYLLLRGLARTTYDPFVMAYHDAYWRGPIEALGVPVETLNTTSRLAKIILTIRALSRIRPEILHCVGASAGYIGRIAGFVTRVPIVIANERLTPLAKTGTERIIERALLPFTSLVMCNSNHARRAYQNVLDFPVGKLQTITNAIDVPEQPVIPWRCSEAPRIGYVANYRPLKRHDLFVAAAVQIARRFPGATFQLVGWGAGQARVEEMARAAGLSHCFRFLGEVGDTASFYQGLDIYLHVAEMEGVSNAILEAMSCRVPCIVTKTESNIEVVRHRENGLACDSSAEEIGRMVELLEADPVLTNSLVDRAYHELPLRFSPATLSRETEEQYRRLLHHRT